MLQIHVKKTRSKNAKCHNVVAWKKREKSKQNSSFKMHQNLIGSLIQTCFSTRWRHCFIAWCHLVKKVFDGGPIWNVFNSERYFHSFFYTFFSLSLTSVLDKYIWILLGWYPQNRNFALFEIGQFFNFSTALSKCGLFRVKSL